MTVVLTENERQRLMRPVRGQGGWQRLLRRLQANLRGNVLTLSAQDVSQVRKYRNQYGDGGWQGRLGFLRRVSLDTAA